MAKTRIRSETSERQRPLTPRQTQAQQSIKKTTTMRDASVHKCQMQIVGNINLVLVYARFKEFLWTLMLALLLALLVKSGPQRLLIVLVLI